MLKYSHIVNNSSLSGQFVKLSFSFKMSSFYNGKFGRAMSDFKHGHWRPVFDGRETKS